MTRRLTFSLMALVFTMALAVGLGRAALFRGLHGPRDGSPHLSGVGSPVAPAVDSVIAEFRDRHRVPGLAVCLVDQGRVIHLAGYGFADLEAEKPVTPTTLFHTASVSKTFVATAVMQLVQTGRID